MIDVMQCFATHASRLMQFKSLHLRWLNARISRAGDECLVACQGLIKNQIDIGM
jgi:hypothetical protein